MGGALELQRAVKKVTHHNFRVLRRGLFDPPIVTHLFTPEGSSFAICPSCPRSKKHMHIEKQNCELHPGHSFSLCP